ncbi:hypothetical protein Dsi01nite_027690 [Dactylosporangium siamense]|uniref:Uncharacterized protein n=1 Tax=Dactylosporangium siamense TaxID=685454 RepID=A0A919UBK5_9ACTN|nr:hypothetical protein Dsi01nite_027690 [Dactylosporangium siamense]
MPPGLPAPFVPAADAGGALTSVASSAAAPIAGSILVRFNMVIPLSATATLPWQPPRRAKHADLGKVGQFEENPQFGQTCRADYVVAGLLRRRR